MQRPPQSRPAGVAPGGAGEAELEAGGLPVVHAGEAGRVALGRGLLEDLLVAGREVDQAEVVGARQADAAEPEDEFEFRLTLVRIQFEYSRILQFETDERRTIPKVYFVFSIFEL